MPYKDWREPTIPIEPSPGYIALGYSGIGSQKITLKQENDTKRENNGNNRQWAEICKFYGLTKDDFTQ